MGQSILRSTTMLLMNKFSTSLFLALIVSGLFWSAYAQPGFKRVFVEKIPVTEAAHENDESLPLEAFAYRVFVALDSGYEMQAVYGASDPSLALIYKTTTAFYNNSDFGGTSGKEVLTSLISSDPALAYDSYITIGFATNNRLGIPYEEDTTDGIVDGLISGTTLPLQTIGADFDLPFGTESYEGEFKGVNCTYNVNGGTIGPTPSNMVLIGQFTTDGEFSFEISIQYRNLDKGEVIKVSARKSPGLIYRHPDLHYPGPEVEITSPADQSVFSTGESVNIQASTTGEEIAEVSFLLDGNLLATDTVAPYQISWIAEEGDFAFQAVALDSLGAIDSSSVVHISAGSFEAPLVSIVAPANQDTFLVEDVIVIEAEASDADGEIVMVEFLVNDELVGSDTLAPFAYDWTALTPGIAEIQARATDDDGLQTISDTVFVFVDEETGIWDEKLLGTLEVYPNPANESILIRLSGTRAENLYVVKVMDINGKVIVAEHNHNFLSTGTIRLNLSSWPAGMYQVTIADPSGASTSKKFIKQ